MRPLVAQSEVLQKLLCPALFHDGTRLRKRFEKCFQRGSDMRRTNERITLGMVIIGRDRLGGIRVIDAVVPGKLVAHVVLDIDRIMHL